MNNDQNIMENLLLTAKGVCDLYMHGTIESCTQNVNATFEDALNQSLCIQDGLYQKMAAQGWYPTQTAPQQQINQVRTKFANQNL